MKSIGSKMKKNRNNFGFTLIELIIVISLIGVLAGVLMTVVNQERQQEYAGDAVKRQDLKSLIDGFESMYTAERFYPERGATTLSNNPCDSPAPNYIITQNYLTCGPWDTAVGAEYVYNSVGSPATDFCVHVQMSTSTNYFKYCSSWTGTDKVIRECTLLGMGACN